MNRSFEDYALESKQHQAKLQVSPENKKTSMKKSVENYNSSIFRKQKLHNFNYSRKLTEEFYNPEDYFYAP